MLEVRLRQGSYLRRNKTDSSSQKSTGVGTSIVTPKEMPQSPIISEMKAYPDIFIAGTKKIYDSYWLFGIHSQMRTMVLEYLSTERGDEFG